MRTRHSREGLKHCNIFEATDVHVLDPNRFLLRLCIPNGDLYFQAPNRKIFLTLQSVLSKYQDEYSQLHPDKRKALRRESLQREPISGDAGAGSPRSTTTKGDVESSAADPSKSNASHNGDNDNDDDRGSVNSDDDDHDGGANHVEPSLMDWPKTKFAIFTHIALLPVKASL
jgi:hypothetical protein